MEAEKAPGDLPSFNSASIQFLSKKEKELKFGTKTAIVILTFVVHGGH